MKLALIVLAAVVVITMVAVIHSRIAYRRWREWFDSLPPDQQRKEQERLYKAHQ